MARINPKAKNTNNKTDTAKNDTSTQTDSTKSSYFSSSGFRADQLSFVKSLQTKPTTQSTQPTTKTDKPIVPTTTQVNPYASTQQVRGKSQIYSQNSKNLVNVATNESNKAQPKYFTLATNASGQSYTIKSGLSLEARQYYKKLGVTTTSILNPDWKGASKQDVMIDDTKVSGTDKSCSWFGCPTVKVGTLGDPVGSSYDNDLPATKDKEDNPIANDVKSEANPSETTPDGVTTYDTNDATAPNADQRYDDGRGKVWDNNHDEPLMILSGCEGNQSCFEQWMSQMNEEIVPTTTYGAFTGDTQISAGVEKLKLDFANVLHSKWFPFLIIGVIAIIALSYLKGKPKSQVPTKVINF